MTPYNPEITIETFNEENQNTFLNELEPSDDIDIADEFSELIDSARQQLN